MIFGRLSDRGTLFKSFWRSGQDLDFVGVYRVRPESGDPPHATIDFDPFSGSPSSTVWLFTPDSADPNEVAAVFVPRPIAGDPNGSRIRVDFRREFFDWLGWRFWYDGTRGNVELKGLGESFVDGAAKQRLDTLRHIVGDCCRIGIAGGGGRRLWQFCESFLRAVRVDRIGHSVVCHIVCGGIRSFAVCVRENVLSFLIGDIRFCGVRFVGLGGRGLIGWNRFFERWFLRFASSVRLFVFWSGEYNRLDFVRVRGVGFLAVHPSSWLHRYREDNG